MNRSRRDALLLRLIPAILDAPIEANSLLERMNDLLALNHPAAVAELEQGLELLCNRAVSLLLFGRATSIVDVPIAERRRRLQQLSAAWVVRLRTLYLAIQRLVVSSYYSEPAVQRSLGYPGPKGAA